MTIPDVKDDRVYIQRQLRIEPRCFSLSLIGVPSSFNNSLTCHIPWNAHEQGGGELILDHEDPNATWRRTT